MKHRGSSPPIGWTPLTHNGQRDERTASCCQELERFNQLTERMSKSLMTLRRALAGEVGMSNELEELARSIYNGTLPDMWRRSTPATLKSLGNWMLYHVDRHTQYYSWVHEREPQVRRRCEDCFSGWRTIRNNNYYYKPCKDYSDTVRLKVFQGHIKKLYYITVSLPEKRWQTVLSSVSGGTQAVTGFALPKLEGNFRHATLQLETHDHQWWLDVSVVRRVSTSKQTGDDDVLVHQPSTDVS